MFSQLVNLVLVIHRTVDHLLLLGVPQVASRTTGMCEDNALRRNAKSQDLKEYMEVMGMGRE